MKKFLTKASIYKQAAAAIVLMAAFFVSPAVFAAWVGPTADPPDGNAPGFIYNTTNIQNGANLNISGSGTFGSVCLGGECKNTWSQIQNFWQQIFDNNGEPQGIYYNPAIGVGQAKNVVIGSNAAGTAQLQVVGGGYGTNFEVIDNNNIATTIELKNTFNPAQISSWRLQAVSNQYPGKSGNFEIVNVDTFEHASMDVFSISSYGKIGVNKHQKDNDPEDNQFTVNSTQTGYAAILGDAHNATNGVGVFGYGYQGVYGWGNYGGYFSTPYETGTALYAKANWGSWDGTSWSGGTGLFVNAAKNQVFGSLDVGGANPENAAMRSNGTLNVLERDADGTFPGNGGRINILGVRGNASWAIDSYSGSAQYDNLRFLYWNGTTPVSEETPLTIERNVDAGTKRVYVGNYQAANKYELWFYGDLKPAGSTCTAGQTIKKAASGTAWVCANDNAGAGSGTANYVPKWNSAGNGLWATSTIYIENGGVGIGIAPPNLPKEKLDVNGAISLVNNKAQLYAWNTDTNLVAGLRLNENWNGSQDVVTYNGPSGLIGLDNGGLSLAAIPNRTAGSAVFTGTYGRLDINNDGSIFTSGNLQVGGTADSYFMGKVGIGTTAPVSNLDVRSSSGGILSLSSSDTDIQTGESVGQLNFYTADASNLPNRNVAIIKSLAEAAYTGTDNAQTALTFWTHGNNAAATEKMRINAAGNVGIGTAAPAYKLEVGGSAKVNSLNINGAYNLPTAVGTNSQFLRGDGTWAVPPAGTTLSGTANYMPKWNAAGTGLTASSQIFDNGTNVGVNTTDPHGRLDVSTNANYTGNFPLVITNLNNNISPNYDVALAFKLSNYSTAGEQLKYVSIRAVPEEQYANAIGLAFYSKDNGVGEQERLRISKNGNVGIGTAVPIAKLDVNGQVRITGGSPGAGKVLTSDASGLATWALPSSFSCPSCDATFVNEGQTDSITATMIATDAVGAAEIAANAVGTSEIAADAVRSAHILSNTITADDLADDSVGAGEIAVGAVGDSELSDNLTSVNSTYLQLFARDEGDYPTDDECLDIQEGYMKHVRPVDNDGTKHSGHLFICLYNSGSDKYYWRNITGSIN